MRTHLTYANVMATVAVFIALGGSSYAAVQLSKNSVRSKHIKNGQVKSGDVGRNAVTSAKVKNGTLLSADFKPGQLPAGAPGKDGAPGAPGRDGTPGAPGAPGTARAYGRVFPAGCGNGSGTSPDVCTPDRARSLAVLRLRTNSLAGTLALPTYCISVPGVDSRETLAVATVDDAGSDLPPDAFGRVAVLAVADPTQPAGDVAPGCPKPTDFVVRTMASSREGVRDDSTEGSVLVQSYLYYTPRVAFTFMVP